MHHIPVLLEETLSFLRPERGGIYIDATLGLGGHSAALLETNPSIHLIGIDQDEEALESARKRLGPSAICVHANFGALARIAQEQGVHAADGILMDLGISSYQIDTPARGFSFQEDGPLDMRMDPSWGSPASTIINGWSEFRLAELFYLLGEERLSRQIARHIVEKRKAVPIHTTRQLAEIIVESYPPPLRHKHPHPATKVFQALRLEVNRELERLEEGMEAALSLLAPQGVLVIISFHSLEDRLVKRRFRQAADSGEYTLLTKKPVVADPAEIERNPRSRSAKLRAICKN